MFPKEQLLYGKLPSFICLGAQKCGTTWLYLQLQQHPDVYLPKKEFRYFNNYMLFSKYLSSFQDADNKITGDFTPEYFVDEKSAVRIKFTVPKAKLFAIIRNPTERAFSQWKMQKVLNNIKTNFLETFNDNLGSIQSRGIYIQQIQRYPDAKIYFFEKIIKNRVSFLLDLEKYLGIMPFIPKNIHEFVSHKYHDFKFDKITTNEKDIVDKFYYPYNKELEKYFGVKNLWM